MRLSLRLFVPAIPALLMLPSVLSAKAQDTHPVITLAPPAATAGEADAQQTGAKPKAVTSRVITRPDGVQEVYREFGSAKVGQDAPPEYFLLQFHAATKLTAITPNGDFHVAPGGTCMEGYTYAAGQSCDVKLVFTPTGPGHRTGQLSVAHSASATPFVTPTGGQAYGPAVSFVPSQIETVTGTLSGSGAGTLDAPSALAVDGGDNLYIADTGNNLVKAMDSTGTIRTITGGGTASPVGASGAGTSFALSKPTGVTADPYGHLFLVVEDAPAVLEQYANGYATDIFNSSGENIYCSYSLQCLTSSVYLYYPTSIAADLYGSVFFNEPLGDVEGLNIYNLAEFTPNAAADNYYLLITDGSAVANYITAPQFAVDSNDDLLYPLGPYSGICQIVGQNQEENDFGNGESWVVAGSGPCGFSGDGGRAGSAEIGASIGQISLDAAGNVYFTDSNNNRVRRVDAVSGVIRTIAGNGSTGYGGDGGASTSANLQAPVGVAVDSTGKVYATATAASNANNFYLSDIRAFGNIGFLNLGSIAVGTPSATQTVLLSNVGNDALNFFHIAVGSGNTTDFTIDPNTTTCIVGVPLQSGHNCNIGLIFTPTAVGNRAASVLVADDTVNGLNTVEVSGTGYTTATLTPASLTFASTTVGSSTAAQVATLTNTGKATMIIGSLVFSGTNATSFSDTTTCGTTLAVAASCTISVTFKPATTGTLTATLTVTDSTSAGKQTVALTGVGAAAAAKPALSPASLTFAEQSVGTASAAQTINLSNTGTAALGVTSITLTGTNPGDYTVSNSCGTSVAAGGSCTITVTFKPAAAGTRTASVSVVTSAGTLTDAVSGTGAASVTFALSPASLTFGSQTLGTTSAAQTIKLSNTGTAALGVTSIKMTGTDPGDYAVSNNCGTSLATGGSCTITVTFTPTAVGTRTASVSVAASTGTLSATVTGTAVSATTKPKVALTSMANPVGVNQTLLFTAHVAGSSNSTATGTVQLMEGGKMWTEGVLTAGTVALQVQGLPIGVHMLTAVYMGDAKNGEASSAALRQVVVPLLEDSPSVPGADASGMKK